MNNLISVIVPVYNVKPYIDKCMQTILSQTYSNLEIILVDDGSTDGSSDVCDTYAASDSRIKVIHKENGGLSSARNAALDIATGDYIGFVDSDDYIHVQMFEKLIDASKKSDCEISICAHYTEKGDTLYIDEPVFDNEIIYTPNDAQKTLIEDINIRSYAWDKLYKANLFEGVRYPVGRNYEDIATTHILFSKAKKICHIPQYLYYYQIREGSISNHPSLEKWQKNCADIIISQKERYNFFIERGEKDLALLVFSKMLDIIYEYISNCYKLKNFKGCTEQKKYLSENKDVIMNNPYISEKNKKLFTIYTASSHNFKLYSATKSYAKSVKQLSYSVNDKLHEYGIKVPHKYDFSLKNKNTKRLILFELPCFDNLGDHAIAYAQKKFLEDIAKKTNNCQLFVIEGWDTVNAIGQLRPVIKKDDIIFLQGGGNFGNLYTFAGDFRQKIAKAFSKNTIIMFPQTVYFTNDSSGRECLKRSQKIYNNCAHLKMFARDNVSYNLMKKYYKADINPMNDIVGYLDESCYSLDEKRSGIMLCLRSDKESSLSSSDKKALQKLCEENSSYVLVSDTVTKTDTNISNREKILQNKWKTFGKMRLVVTDRLHGMIFSIITKTPCIVLGNNHHKVEETYKTFSKCDYLYYAKSTTSVNELIKQALSDDIPSAKTDFSKKYILTGLLTHL